MREQKVFADAQQKLDERITHEPLGVVANISGWNYPYFVGSNVFIPALVAGNAVVRRQELRYRGLTLSTMGIQTFTRPKAWHLKG